MQFIIQFKNIFFLQTIQFIYHESTDAENNND